MTKTDAFLSILHEYVLYAAIGVTFIICDELKICKTVSFCKLSLVSFKDSCFSKSPLELDICKFKSAIFALKSASVEYFKVIDRPSLDINVITPQFKDMKNGKYKMISFFAKKARGMMARFIIQNRIEHLDDILNFDLGGYSYNKSLSTPNQPVFTRSQS